MYDAADSSPIDDARAQAGWRLNQLLVKLDGEGLRAQLRKALPGVDPAALEAALRADASALWPTLRVAGDDVLGGAYGAYAAGSKTIFISQAALDRDLLEPGSLEGVLLEELGHHLDALFGSGDTPGDEGAAFRTLALTGQAMGPRAYDDHGVISIDGEDVAVEFANYSKSGGFEGDTFSLKLEGAGDNEITYAYSMLDIPDQLSIRYGGQTLLNTGFVSGASSGKFTVKRAGSDSLLLTLGTADSGTAWSYSVSTGPASGLVTSPLIIGAAADFKDDDKDGTYEFIGTTSLGMEGGLQQGLLMAAGATFKADKTKLTVVGGGLDAAVLGKLDRLLDGGYEVDYATGVGSALSTGKLLPRGGLDVDLRKFQVFRDEVRFDTAFTLPTEIGGQRVEDSSGGLGSAAFVLGASGLRLGGPGGKHVLPDNSFNFFKLFNVAAVAPTISYFAATDSFRYQGLLQADAFIKDDTPGVGNLLALNLAGDDFVETRAGTTSFKGALDFKTLLIKAFEIQDGEFRVDTLAKTFGLAGSIKFPLGNKVPNVTFDVNSSLDSQGLIFNSMTANITGQTQGIGSAGLQFNKFVAEYKDLSTRGAAPSLVTGTLGYSYADRLVFDRINNMMIGRNSPATVDFTGTFQNKTDFTAEANISVIAPEVFNIKGSVNFNWSDFDLSLGDVAFTGLFGLVKGAASFRADKSLNFSASANATLQVPPTVDFGETLNLFRGVSLAGAKFQIAFSNDRNTGNDYVAAWANAGAYVLGFKVRFDGTVETIGAAKSIPAPLSMALPSDEPLSTASLLDAALATGPRAEAVTVAQGAPYLMLVLAWTQTAAARPALTVTRPDGTVLAEPDFAANGVSVVPELSAPGRVTLVVDPANGAPVAPGSWIIATVSSTGLGTVTTGGFEGVDAGATLGFGALTPTANGATIAYTGAVTGAAGGVVDLFYDTDANGLDGVVIATGLKLTDTGYAWNADGLKPGTYYVYGAVTPDGSNPRYAYAPVPVVVTGQADLAATMTGPATADISAPGGVFYTYTVRVTNPGTSVARNVVVSETTDPSAFLSYRVNGGALTAVPAATGTFNIVVGDLAAGATRDVTVALAPSTSFRSSLSLADGPNTTFINTVVTTSTYDPNHLNNQPELAVDFFSATRIPPASRADVDLKVELVKAAETAPVGGTQSYQVKVTNAGPDVADSVFLREFTPGLINITAARSGGGLVGLPGGAQVSAVSLGSLAPGASTTVTFSGRVLFAGETISTSLVETANGFDIDATNNALTQYRTGAVGAALTADMSLTGAVSNTAPAVGDTVTLTYTLRNAGPNVGSALTVKLDAGAGLQLISGSTLQGSFSAATGVWSAGNISENVTRTLTVQARVTAAADFGVTAEIAAQGEADPDSTPGNRVVGEDDFVALLGGTVTSPGTPPVTPPTTPPVTPPVTPPTTPPTGPAPVIPTVPPSEQIRLDVQFGNLARIDPARTDMTSTTLAGPDGVRFANPFLAQLTLEKAIAGALDSGVSSKAVAEAGLTRIVDGTTSVAEISYAFFTGRTPSAAGLNYLVHSDANANDLNDSYYSQFSTENRYINFAVALAKGGPGASVFASQYASLSLQDAASRAYQQVFGTPATAAKITDILGELVPNGRGGLETRAQYFAEYGGDGANGLGTKAAMMGYLLAESVKVGFGAYQQANLHFLQTLSHGSAAYEVDLLAVYGPPITLTGQPTPDASVFG